MSITEKELILPSLQVISDSGDGISTSDLIVELRKKVQLSPEDMEILQWRKDDKFSQKVRNLVSHKTLEKEWYVKFENKKFYILDRWEDYILLHNQNSAMDKIKIIDNKKINIRDFNQLRFEVKKKQTLEGIEKEENAFIVYIGEKFFPEDFDIHENITDTAFFKEKIMIDRKGWDDYWIDMFIKEELSNKRIKYKLFNFKYTCEFKKSSESNFPWSEIQKVHSIIQRFATMDEMLLEENINENLKNLVQDIISLNNEWYIIDYEVIFVSNYYNWFTAKDEEISDNLLSFYYQKNDIMMPEIIKSFNNNDFDAKVRIDSKDFFEISGWTRSIILNIDAENLLRIVSMDEKFRNDSATIEFGKILQGIEKKMFDENVRIYLNEKNKNLINNNITDTANENKENFFCFNNGITLVCKKYSCPDNPTDNKNSPLPWRKSDLLMQGIQIVNGQQTIYSLFKAYEKDPEGFSSIHVLCKIFEVEDKKLREQIAEYTNSQNSVKRRDIRSIDSVQRELQKDLEIGYNILYERKKNEFALNNPKSLERLDSEKAWQLVLSFYLEKPAKAKNKKSSIFDEEYDAIFWYSAEEFYIAYALYNFIETKRKDALKKLNDDLKSGQINSFEYSKEAYIQHCSLFLLFALKKLAEKSAIEFKKNNIKSIEEKYWEAIKIIDKMIKNEFFDNEWKPLKALLYWPFFKNTSSQKLFDSIIWSKSSNDLENKMLEIATKYIDFPWSVYEILVWFLDDCSRKDIQIINLSDIYDTIWPVLREIYPENKDINAQIRKVLQQIRDTWILEFLGDGRYKISHKILDEDNKINFLQ